MFIEHQLAPGDSVEAGDVCAVRVVKASPGAYVEIDSARRLSLETLGGFCEAAPWRRALFHAGSNGLWVQVSSDPADQPWTPAAPPPEPVIVPVAARWVEVTVDTYTVPTSEENGGINYGNCSGAAAVRVVVSPYGTGHLTGAGVLEAYFKNAPGAVPVRAPAFDVPMFLTTDWVPAFYSREMPIITQGGLGPGYPLLGFRTVGVVMSDAGWLLVRIQVLK